MHTARFLTVFALAAGAGFIVANCGGSDSSSNSGGLTCPNSSGSTGTCSAEQTKAYGDCVQSKCDSAYQACLGSGYKSGSFGGACGSWIGCYAKCNCDKNCQGLCAAPPAECQTCLIAQVTPCQLNSGCTPPTCTGTGGSGGGGGSGGSAGTGGSGGGGTGGTGGGGLTCSDLMKCCNAMTDAMMKASCQQALAGVMAGGDQACGGVLSIYRASGLCP